MKERDQVKDVAGRVYITEVYSMAKEFYQYRLVEHEYYGGLCAVPIGRFKIKNGGAKLRLDELDRAHLLRICKL
jgi:hypothetical protein